MIWLILAGARLTGTGLHAPPGDYDTWTPRAPGFPGLMKSYTDPVFGTEIIRMTARALTQGGEGIAYGLNGRWNASGRWYMGYTNSQAYILDVTTGAVVRGSVPYPFSTNAEVSFDPADPDRYYYTDGTRLLHYRVSTGATSTVKTFGSRLGGLGQSGDFISANGRYFLLHLGGNLRVWDKQTDTLFSGSIPMPAAVPPGWIGLSPDANYVIVNGNPDHRSYAVSLTTRTVSTSGVMFWNACYDHGDIMTASDGKTYLITSACLYDRAVYRVLVTNNALNAQGRGIGTAQLTLPGNVRLFPISASGVSGNGHFACAATAPNQDWCAATTEDPSDQIGNPGRWYPYKQEIVWVHMVAPYEVFRLAHHRARPLNASGAFCYMPRISVSWDGTRLMFPSNMSLLSGSAGCRYGDLYMIQLE